MTTNQDKHVELWDIHRQDLAHSIKRISDIESRLNSLVRTFKLDERQQKDEAVADQKLLIGSMARTTSQLAEVARIQKMILGDQFTEQDTTFFLTKHRQYRNKKRSHELGHTHFLSGLEKKMVAKCPVHDGEHKGIAFKDPDDKRSTLETVCPVEWWGSMSRLHFHEGTLAEFREEHPFEEYMKRFRHNGK